MITTIVWTLIVAAVVLIYHKPIAAFAKEKLSAAIKAIGDE